MQVKPVISYGVNSNAYILTQDGKTAVIIDPSSPEVFSTAQNMGLECNYVLLTHGHFDHVGGLGSPAAGGAKILCGEQEKDFIFSEDNRGIFGGVYIPSFCVHGVLLDGQVIQLCGITITALHTPGHTAGSMCYIAGDCLFSGDTLFKMSIGRTDLPTGDYKTILASLKKLKELEDDFTVCPGHGEMTTLGRERQYNPYLKLC